MYFYKGHIFDNGLDVAVDNYDLTNITIHLDIQTTYNKSETIPSLIYV